MEQPVATDQAMVKRKGWRSKLGLKKQARVDEGQYKHSKPKWWTAFVNL